MTENAKPCRDAAIAYAKCGKPVIPLHSIRDGVCTCGKADCSSPGKHPRTRNGLKDATTAARQIEAWFRKWPDANVGICTGATSGVIGIDIDFRHGGDRSLADLERQHGELPETTECLTGGGGRHLYFKHPGGTIRNRANVRPGIDVRGDGGYLLGPPSSHISGGVYQWRSGHSPDDSGVKLASAPTWLLNVIKNDSERPAERRTSNGDGHSLLLQRGQQYAAGADSVPEGERNNAAFRLAGHLASFQTEQGDRLSKGEILELTRLWNLRNSPPLDDPELQTAVASALNNGSERAPHVVTEVRKNAERRTSASVTRSKKVNEPREWTPFPTSYLPSPIDQFVEAGGKALGCDECFISLPVLAGLAGAIGNSRRIRLKNTWKEPSVLWMCTIAESGALKSPSQDLAIEPLQKMHDTELAKQQQERERYEQDVQIYEADYAEWKRTGRKRLEPPPAKPEEPKARRYICSDVTIEGLAPLLEDNPRGLLLARDELAGLFNSFDAYKSVRGSDVGHWLSIHRAGSITVDRKTGKRVLHVPRANVSITGTVQPGALKSALFGRYPESDSANPAREHFENGLAARIQLAMPPKRPRVWTEETIPDSLRRSVNFVFQDLTSLEMNRTEDGQLEPVDLDLSPGAKKAWVRFYNDFGKEQAALSGDLSACFSKLEACCARFALIFHLVRVVANDPCISDPSFIDETSIGMAVDLTRWFGNEAARVYQLIGGQGESPEEREIRELLEAIRKHQGAVSVRDLMRSGKPWRDKTAEEIEVSLNRLGASGFGRWVVVKTAGRPARVFTLSSGCDRSANLGNAGKTDLPS